MSDGPYFPGQEPASDCGHYHPDVFCLGVYRHENGCVYRVVDCCKCNLRIEQMICCSHHVYPFPEILDKGILTEEQAEDYRKKTKERFKHYVGYKGE